MLCPPLVLRKGFLGRLNRTHPLFHPLAPFCPASIRTLVEPSTARCMLGSVMNLSGCCLLSSELAVLFSDHASSAATSQSPRPSAFRDSPAYNFIALP